MDKATLKRRVYEWLADEDAARAKYGEIGEWDVSGVTDMSEMFYNAVNFNSDVSEWNVSGVTDMSKMFYFARNFNSDVSQWDVSGVTDMGSMFSGAGKFNSDVSQWDVSGVTDMSWMFSGAGNFNSDVSQWDVSGVTDMSYMFSGADNFNRDVSQWDVSGVTDMSGMFSFAGNFNSDLTTWRFDVPPATVSGALAYTKSDCMWDPRRTHVDAATGIATRISPGRFYCNDPSKPRLKDGEVCNYRNPNPLARDDDGDSGDDDAAAVAAEETCQTTMAGGPTLCRSRCCDPFATDACPICGLDGSCYYPLTTHPTNWNASVLDASVGFRPLLTTNEFVRVDWNNVDTGGTKRQTLFNPEFMLEKSDGNPLAANYSQFAFQLKWLLHANTTGLKVGGNTPVDVEWDEEGGGPGGIGIDSGSGEIFAAPRRNGSYTAWLIAVDTSAPAAQQDLPTQMDQILLKKWDVQVIEPKSFKVLEFEHYIPQNTIETRFAFLKTENSTLNNDPLRTPANVAILQLPYFGKRAVATSGTVNDADSFQTLYADVSVLLPPIRLITVLNNKGANFTFTVDVTPSTDAFFIDPKTGAMTANPSLPTNSDSINYNAIIYAVDGGGSRAEVETIRFAVIQQDILTPANGPGGKTCANGVRVDGTKFNRNFACNCNGTAFQNQNCDVEKQCARNESLDIVAGECNQFLIDVGESRVQADTSYTDPKEEEYFAVGDTYQIGPMQLKSVVPSSGSNTSGTITIRYLASPVSVADQRTGLPLVGKPPALPLGFFINAQTGDILVDFRPRDDNMIYSVSVQVEDDDGARVEVERMAFKVKYRDVDPNHPNRAILGPHNSTCKNGGAVIEGTDGNPFDGRYSCDCDAIPFSGENCEFATVCKATQSFIGGVCADFNLVLDKTVRNRASNDSAVDYTDPQSMMLFRNHYTFDQTYRIAPLLILDSTKYTVGTRGDLTFTMETDANGFFLNPRTGELQGSFAPFEPRNATQNYSIILTAVDGGGAKQTVEVIRMRVRYEDSDVPSYGPNDRPCSKNSNVNDTVLFDYNYECECHAGFGGQNCDERKSLCRANEIIDMQGDCQACLLSSVPDSLTQTECVVDECVNGEMFMETGICTCKLESLTNLDASSVEVVCNASRWPEFKAASIGERGRQFPQFVSKLTLMSASSQDLPKILKELSIRHEPQASDSLLVAAAQIATSSNGTGVGNSSTAAEYAVATVTKSTILAVVVEQGALFGSSSPSVEASAAPLGANDDANTTTSTAASETITPLPGCGMAGFVPALDFDVPIAVCTNDSGGGDQESSCSNADLCPAGQFADMSNTETPGACTACERGGFYADTAGRVGAGSHCACTPCINGSWSAQPGATAITQCQICPRGTQTDAPAGYRACKCLPGFSRTERFGECASCEGVLGIECSGDARKLKQGFYWAFPTEETERDYLAFTANLQISFGYNQSLSQFNGTYPKAKACPTPENCLGVTNAAAATCLVGTMGPLCAVCEDTHYRLNGKCSKCPGNKTASAALLVVIAVVLIAAVWVILRCNANDVPAVNAWNKADPGDMVPFKSGEHDDPSAVSFMTVAKIILSYTQVKSLLVEVYPGVKWPTSFRSFTDSQQFVSSNPVSIVMPSCLSASLTVSSYGEFMIAALTPLVVAPLIWMYYMIRSRCSQDTNQLCANCISTASFVYFLLYPTIAVSSVRVLAECDEICRTADGSDCIPYLRSDYSIQCDTDTHTNYKIGAAIAFAFYSVILPAVIACVLYQGRKGASKSTVSVWMAGFSFYSKNYKPEYYFWETVDLYRKLCVASLVVFIADGTSLQITFGIIFAFVGFALQLFYNPFVNRNENRLAVASQAITVLALIIGGLIRAHEAEMAAQMDYGEINDVVTAAYLITSGILIYCLGLIVWILHKYRNARKRASPSESDANSNVVVGGEHASFELSPASDFSDVTATLAGVGSGAWTHVKETSFETHGANASDAYLTVSQHIAGIGGVGGQNLEQHEFDSDSDSDVEL